MYNHSSGDGNLHFSGTDSAVEQSLREEQEKGSGAEAERQAQPKNRTSGELPTLLQCTYFVLLNPLFNV